MALYGNFYLNKAKFAPLEFAGVGRFMAFSGNGVYRNQPGCTSVMSNGALPAGEYWIVERPTGGVKTRAWVALQDLWTGNNHNEWFALYRNDSRIDDWTWINSVKRGNFRLHPIGIYGVSEGCITLQHHTDFYTIRNSLLHGQKMSIPGTALSAFGKITVHGYEKNCTVNQ